MNPIPSGVIQYVFTAHEFSERLVLVRPRPAVITDK